jgi:(p)ppGpp synthase/HD superfamily hydrolase
MEKYDKLKISLRYYLLGKSYSSSLMALNIAQKVHNGLRKDNITKEFQHQLEMALYITTLKDLMDEEKCLTACLLHDLIEDYPSSIEAYNIKSVFGEEIYRICYLLNRNNYKEDLANKYYYENIAKSEIASIVKGTDRMHNISTMTNVFSKDKMIKYISETKDYVLPMLKESRNSFPQQIQSYFNIIDNLRQQIRIIEPFLK